MHVAARTEAAAIDDELDDISEDEGPLATMQRELQEAKKQQGSDGGVGIGL